MGVAAIMLAHDWSDGLGGFIGVVERDSADIVMQDVGFDDAVEKLTSDEAKLTIDRGSSASCVGPSRRSVVRQRWSGMLEECYGN